MSLEVNSGTFSYQKGHPVLMDVSFSAEPGEVVAILGPNGAGKTTLLKCMLGFLPWEKGYTSINGKKLKDWKRSDLWKHISYVPQAREPAFSYRTEDMVLLGRSPYLGNFASPGKKDLEIAMRAMELAGISHLKGKSCSQISGGELQLVLIARALASEPGLMVLDEPESGLDFRNQLVVLELLKRLSQEEGLTIIINTHYPDHALRIADHSFLLYGSNMHLFGKTEYILTSDHMQSAFKVDIAVQKEVIEGQEYPTVIPLRLLEK
ncbi:MAG: ABC transporter ATP-binding protein [Parasporobacterium sp.]|nr:ABC transporter ATP-binding protein [Parasporobacterium sp.]